MIYLSIRLPTLKINTSQAAKGDVIHRFSVPVMHFAAFPLRGQTSHIAWLRAIEGKIEFNGLKNVKVTFPVIADIGMEVSEMYGMIQSGESDTKAVHAVFFICPRGTIRAMIYYPLSLGRNFDETKRFVFAGQFDDLVHNDRFSMVAFSSSKSIASVRLLSFFCCINLNARSKAYWIPVWKPRNEIKVLYKPM